MLTSIPKVAAADRPVALLVEVRVAVVEDVEVINAGRTVHSNSAFSGTNSAFHIIWCLERYNHAIFE